MVHHGTGLETQSGAYSGKPETICGSKKRQTYHQHAEARRQIRGVEGAIRQPEPERAGTPDHRGPSRRGPTGVRVMEDHHMGRVVYGQQTLGTVIRFVSETVFHIPSGFRRIRHHRTAVRPRHPDLERAQESRLPVGAHSGTHGFP